MADNVILCSRYYDCSKSGVPCSSILIDQTVDTSLAYVQEDKELTRVRQSARAWIGVGVVNLVGMVMLTFGSLLVRVFPSDSSVAEYQVGENAWHAAGPESGKPG